jgi:hypothetical protein
MRSDVQDIFKLTPHDKQVMMFSATLNQEMRTVCKKFMSNVRDPEHGAGGRAATGTDPLGVACGQRRRTRRGMGRRPRGGTGCRAGSRRAGSSRSGVGAAQRSWGAAHDGVG